MHNLVGIPFEPLGNFIPYDDIVFLSSLVRTLDQRQEAIEVGSWAGASAFCLSTAFERLFCIDTWRGAGDNLGEIARGLPDMEPLRVFCRNLQPELFRSIFPVVGTSLFWAKIWPRPVDFIYIDADHEYLSIKEDMEIWSKHVRPGGIIAGHDAKIYEKTVGRAACEFGAHIEGNIWWKLL